MFRMIIIFLASILYAVSLNLFLIPHHILSGGVTGIAMILSFLTPINTGIMIFLLNIPIFILGFFKLGKGFVAKSLFSVFITSFAMQWIPVTPVAGEPILSAIFGAVLGGLAVGVIFRASGSTGGFDIIGLVLTQKRDFPLGSLLFAMNAVVILGASFLFDWDITLLTMLTIYITGKVIDMVHTRHVKITLMIISEHGEKLKDELIKQFFRGITVVEGRGGYSNEPRKILFTVVTRYELTDVKKLIKEVDPNAFVNITETIEVMGFFNRN